MHAQTVDIRPLFPPPLLSGVFSLCHCSHYIGEDWVRKFPLVTGCGASSKTAYAHVVTGVIVIGMTVALLTLLVGGVLSAPNG